MSENFSAASSDPKQIFMPVETDIASASEQANRAATNLFLDTHFAEPLFAAGVPEASDRKLAPPSDRQPAPPSSLTNELAAKYGVQSRLNGNSQEIFYRADGKDNVVLTIEPGTPQARLQAALDEIVKNRIKAAESKFGVKFATPGEAVGLQELEAPNCTTKPGEMMYAVQPTLPGMHAIEEALKRSFPSQFASDGKTGLTLYLLDKKPAPNIYGNRPILGYYSTDKTGKPALFITPAGLALPPTARDTTEGARNLAWVLEHEIAHNSQNNHWTFVDVRNQSRDMGWHDFGTLKGRDGQFFVHGRATCSEPSFWYSVDSNGHPVDATGKRVDTVGRAARYTNEQVQDRAVVRPISYYFTNTHEMLAEGLTAFRMGRDSRQKLLNESPDLYRVAKEYDQQELIKHYGLNENGKSKMIRTPEGFVVLRERATENGVWYFEKGITF